MYPIRKGERLNLRVVGTDHRGITIDVFVALPTRWQRVRRWVVNMVTLK